MAPQTATTDEDLLIISDDAASTDGTVDDSSIEISLDEPAVEEIKTDEVINFDDSSEETPKVEDTTEEVVSEENSVEVEEATDNAISTEEVGLDLSISEETVETPSVSEEVSSDTETESSDFSLDLGDGQEESDTSTETSENMFGTSDTAQATNDGADMNVILDGTIAQLETRQETIATEKDGKSAQVTDLQEQIKKLEEEAALHQGEIEELTAESKKIATNVKSLEKMKLDEEVTKEHNSKRVPKK